jgi:hypothetical protein
MMRIGLTGIFVDDQDRAEQFHAEVLGFQGRPAKSRDMAARPAIGSAATTMRFARCAVDWRDRRPGKRFDGFVES